LNVTAAKTGYSKRPKIGRGKYMAKFGGRSKSFARAVARSRAIARRITARKRGSGGRAARQELALEATKTAAKAQEKAAQTAEQQLAAEVVAEKQRLIEKFGSEQERNRSIRTADTTPARS